MQQNILKESNITKIYLNYIEDGIKKKYSLSLKYMDQKECYFATSFIPGFVKPKRKLEAEIVVYTSDGVYKSKVTICNVNLSMQDVLFQVSLPKTWQFIQLRESTRKRVSLPVKIKYEDGYEINATSYDLALNGVSFYFKGNISSIYKKIPCKIQVHVDGGKYVNIGGFEILSEGKFLREKEGIDDHYGENLYIFKFIGQDIKTRQELKIYLINME